MVAQIAAQHLTPHSLLWTDIFMLYDFHMHIVLHTLPCTCPSQPYIRSCAWVLSHLCVQDAMGTLLYNALHILHCIAFHHRKALTVKSLHMAYIMAQRITPNDTTLPGIVGCFMTCHCSRVGFRQLLPTSFNLMWQCVSSDT